jgi:foldase protein PrsA
VAKVGDTSITKATFEQWMSKGPPYRAQPPNYAACIANFTAHQSKLTSAQKPKAQTQHRSQCEQEYKTRRSNVLTLLINAQWTLKEASNVGVSVTSQEINKQLQQDKKLQYPTEASFHKLLRTTGQTLSDILFRVKLELLEQKIRQKAGQAKGKVTSAELTKLYDDNKAMLSPEARHMPERRELLLVETMTKASAESARQEIQAGKSFTSVAAKRSIEKASNKSGGIEVLANDRPLTEYTKALFTAKKHVLQGPDRLEVGYYFNKGVRQTAFRYLVFEVKAVTPAVEESEAHARSSLKQELISQKEQAALSAFSAEFKTRWKAKTECQAGYVVEDCKEYPAPKTTSTTRTTP